MFDPLPPDAQQQLLGQQQHQQQQLAGGQLLKVGPRGCCGPHQQGSQTSVMS
jgi:hypothetical protein